MCVVITLSAAPVGAEIAVGVNGVAAGGDFAGTFRLQRFVGDTGRLLALGVLTDVSGVDPSRNRPETVRIPVTSVSRSCEMLRVDLGPVDLALKGVAIHLNEFAVHVADAERGPLAQSLCSVANAPDDVVTLVPLLNELVDLIGCLMRGAGGCGRRST